MNDEFKPLWVMAHEAGCTLDEFKAALTEEERVHLVFFLKWCDRWADVQSLMADPVYGEEATLQYDNQQKWVAYQAKRQQEIAALPEIFQQITLEYRRIWWIADVHYPYRSEHVPDSNMTFTSDGMGLGYFRCLSEQHIELVVCNDPDFLWALRRHGIVPDRQVNASTLLRAVMTFVALINAKFERFHGKQAIGLLNPD